MIIFESSDIRRVGTWILSIHSLEMNVTKKYHGIWMNLQIPRVIIRSKMDTGLDVIKSLEQDGILESKNIVIFTASTNHYRLACPSWKVFPSGTGTNNNIPRNIFELTDIAALTTCADYQPRINENFHYLIMRNYFMILY